MPVKDIYILWLPSIFWGYLQYLGNFLPCEFTCHPTSHPTPTPADIWNLLSQAPLQLGPTDVTKAVTNHQKFMKAFKLRENKWEKQGIYLMEYILSREVIRGKNTSSFRRQEVQKSKSFPGIVKTICNGICKKKLHHSWLYTFQDWFSPLSRFC